MSKKIEKIVIIGTGNVSYHLARAFLAAGLEDLRVVARGDASVRRFSAAVPGATVLTGPQGPISADLVVLAVSDDGLDDALSSLQAGDALVVHTSGSVPMEILDPVSPCTGVFYPLQTLTFGKDTDFRQVPLLVEANKPENAARLESLARQITGKVFAVDSGTRRLIHLAAVFASNFSYHLFTVALNMLESEDIPPEMLHPLILETARMAVQEPPGAAQTGPAVRRDQEVIARHLEMLKDQGLYTRIYELLSDSIIIHSKKKKNEL